MLEKRYVLCTDAIASFTEVFEGRSGLIIEKRLQNDDKIQSFILFFPTIKSV